MQSTSPSSERSPPKRVLRFVEDFGNNMDEPDQLRGCNSVAADLVALDRNWTEFPQDNLERTRAADFAEWQRVEADTEWEVLRMR